MLYNEGDYVRITDADDSEYGSTYRIAEITGNSIWVETPYGNWQYSETEVEPA